MKEIKNAKITSADLSMKDHGVLCLQLTLEGDGWGVIFGGYVLGKRYVGIKEFSGSSKGIEEIMRIMDTVGVNCFKDLEGKYIRAEFNGWGSSVKKIGHIIKDKWFDYEEFYKKEEK